MGLETQGFDKLIKTLGEAPAKLRRETDIAVARTAHIVRSKTIKGIGGEYQGSFAPLSEKYAAWKAKKGGSNLILVSGIRKGKKQQLGGNYRNSFAVDKRGDGIYEVGSNHPQARRLEFGFDGKDKKGRTAKTPARPHLNRALKDSQPEFIAEIKDALDRTFK